MNPFKSNKRTNCKNYSVQEQNARKQMNSILQANFAEAEVKAIAHAIKNRTYPEMDITIDSPTARIPTVKITKTTGGGSFYSAVCPNLSCGKLKILGNELISMTAVCNKCYTPFKLYK